MATFSFTVPRHGFQTDDARIKPIAEKVFARERLSLDDATTLYRSSDILAMGWLANQVRERMNGNVAYFNANRHINPTNVCMPACRLYAFARKKDPPATYTTPLEEPFHTPPSPYTQPLTKFPLLHAPHP